MTAIAACRTCGTEPSENARFCHGCGSPVKDGDTRAEYKQVTVLFADVVHSMDIAAAVGAERLREIMTELVDRASAVVQRYGGTVDKFTGDGIMAVFGAPAALEDHAIRACLAALGVQEETNRLAVDIHDRDGVELQGRVGLNSGQVIAGEIGSGALGYTAVGEQVGMAQRMESVAPPGGVMLSASTARLVDSAVNLGDAELVQIRGADMPVPAGRLLSMGGRPAVGHAESNLVGRRWEMAAVEGVLDRAIDSHGVVVTVVGSPGIGKSRLVREVAAFAAGREVKVFSTYCESHATDVPFHVVARLLRAAIGVRGLDGPAARERVRSRVPEADPEDLLLFVDLLGVADPDVALPKIDPDARRRRLTALVNAASLARKTPAVYVIEDAHWIDAVSESMLAEFFTVIPRTPSPVLITYRPEYRGALSQVAGAQTIALAPLSDSETAALVAELLGPDPSVGGVITIITEKAAGNPFFAEEIVRDLAERGVVRGNRSAYESTADAAEISVPATLQATIAARIDRLDPAAKRTLSAAAVIGSRFSRDLLETLGIDPALQDLLSGEFIDQITFTRQPEYAFDHPLIRTVAYEAQLKSDRAELHLRAAAAIESGDPVAADEKAAMIAEHLEAAGDLHAAYGWHMGAGTWSTSRDFAAARVSWQRARQVADRLSSDDPDRLSMRIAPRTLLCAGTSRIGGTVADTGFGALRELCIVARDRRSLAIGMTGEVMALTFHAHFHESSVLASEHSRLLESIGDPALTVGLSYAAIYAKRETGETTEALRLAQRVIDLADGDPSKGNLILGSPLAIAIAFRGEARWCLGLPGWRNDFDDAAAVARGSDPISRSGVILTKYLATIPNGGLLPDAIAVRETAETLAETEHAGDEFALASARLARGLVLVHRHCPEHSLGLDLLDQVREAALQERFSLNAVPIVDIYTAKEKGQTGDLDGAIELAEKVTDDLFASGELISLALSTAVFVESLLRRRGGGDLQEAESALARLAAVPTDSGFVLNEITLLRLHALLTRAHNDDTTYRDYRDRYRDMARTLGFEGHIAWAKAMP
jgi:adenylate cyclase